MDFATRYKEAEVDSVDNYFNLLEEAGAEELFFRCLMRRDDFEKMAEHLDEHFQAQQENPDILKDLEQHVNTMRFVSSIASTRKYCPLSFLASPIKPFRKQMFRPFR